MSAAVVGRVLGRVEELWRYPVKSLGGERVEELRCTERGVAGDRTWAVRGADAKLGSGKTFGRYRRMPGLLFLSSGGGDAEAPWVEFADGERLSVDDRRTAQRIGSIVGEPVDIAHEETDPYVDDSPLHLLSTSSLEWLRRLRPDDEMGTSRIRPNVLIAVESADERPEDSWCGRAIDIGSVGLFVDKKVKRCVMVSMAQPGIGFAPGVLKDLERASGGNLGVYCRVVGDGVVRVGDPVVLH